MNKSYQKYWSEFLSATGRNSSDHEEIPVDEFGDSPELADALIKLILEGTKSATCGLLIAHEKENYPIPQVGDIGMFLGIDPFLLEIEELLASSSDCYFTHTYGPKPTL
ncbi:hypothetical protein N9F48_00385 [Akkermansiaceae bacterium]|nr:hypothetical protein [Akkermansiaceae bacterium]MDB4725394.1 hypothetical protein [Akkermansiaceae bacterium]